MEQGQTPEEAEALQARLQELIKERFNELVAQGVSANDAAAQALEALQLSASGAASGAAAREPDSAQEAPGAMEVSEPEQQENSATAAMDVGEEEEVAGKAEEAEAPSAVPPKPSSAAPIAAPAATPSAASTVAPAAAPAATPAATPATAPATAPIGTPLTLGEVKRLIAECESSSVYTPLIRRVGAVFSDPTSIIESFCDERKRPKLEEASNIFSMLQEVDNEGVRNSLQNALMGVGSSLSYVPFFKSAEERFVPALVALRYEPFHYDPDLVSGVSALLRSLTTMPSESKAALEAFWRAEETSSAEYLVSVLELVQMFITLKIEMGKAVADFHYVEEGVRVLDILHRVNEERNFAPYTDFHNSAVNELATDYPSFLKEDLVSWFKARDEARNGATLPRQSFCEFPYLLDAGSKAAVLHMEARVQQHTQSQDSLREALQSGQAFRSAMTFTLSVRREEIVDDVLDAIAQTPQRELSLPLRVQFVGEEGVDEGGVRKEFFLVMVRQLLDPQFGMFVQDDETRKLWFNPNTFEPPLKFELVGTILGLAIYNSVILDLNLPVVLYKKLLGQAPTLEDLKEYSPQLGRSLEQLIAFGGDVEQTFSLTFEVSEEVFGERKIVPLKEGGAETPVTNENRDEYVRLYVEYVLEKSVAVQYANFHKGFRAVCKDSFLDTFHPEEMQLLLCGSPNLDFRALERSCQYDSGFSRESPTIEYFWSVIHELSEDRKKKFLMFTTGSDRVPIRGLSTLRLTISRNGDDSVRLPTAHTCFNHLLLPEYSSRDVLKERLLLAIEHAEGFGTM